MAGFIPGSRGSLMLDTVALAMFVAIPALLIGINFAKKFQYQTHRLTMMALSLVLLIAVVLFEIEMRMIGWEHLAEASPYVGPVLYSALTIHLVFSVTTTVAIATTVGLATKRFRVPPKPNSHSRVHKILGKISAISLVGTSVTGWIFYWLAFVAD